MKKIVKVEYQEKIFKLLQSGQKENVEMVKYLSEGQGYDLKELLIVYFQEYGPPYFKIMSLLDINRDNQEYILSSIFIDQQKNIYTSPSKWGVDIIGKEIYDVNFCKIYQENIIGQWIKWGYDDNGNYIYFENSDGYWMKIEYDDKGNIIYSVDSNGEWSKREDYRSKIHWEDSDGFIYWITQKNYEKINT